MALIIFCLNFFYIYLTYFRKNYFFIIYSNIKIISSQQIKISKHVKVTYNQLRF